jgi:hypothetical protein
VSKTTSHSVDGICASSVQQPQMQHAFGHRLAGCNQVGCHWTELRSDQRMCLQKKDRSFHIVSDRSGHNETQQLRWTKRGNRTAIGSQTGCNIRGTFILRSDRNSLNNLESRRHTVHNSDNTTHRPTGAPIRSPNLRSDRRLLWAQQPAPHTQAHPTQIIGLFATNNRY